MSLPSLRQLSSATAIAAALLTAACTADTLTASVPADAQQAKGSTPSAPATPNAAVAGSWSAMLPGSGLVDSTQWSLSLSQNNTKVEGSLIRFSYFSDGRSTVSVSPIKKGSISGSTLILEFKGGEGAETPTTFGLIVSPDGRTMSGYHSFYQTEITLARR